MAISQLTPLGASACPLSPARQGTEFSGRLAAESRSGSFGARGLGGEVLSDPMGS